MQVTESQLQLEEVEIDRKPYYLFGTAPDCDFRLPHSTAHHQAALVHNTDGRIFLIDLDSVSFNLTSLP